MWCLFHLPLIFHRHLKFFFLIYEIIQIYIFNSNAHYYLLYLHYQYGERRSIFVIKACRLDLLFAPLFSGLKPTLLYQFLTPFRTRKSCSCHKLKVRKAVPGYFVFTKCIEQNYSRRRYGVTPVQWWAAMMENLSVKAMR